MPYRGPRHKRAERRGRAGGNPIAPFAQLPNDCRTIVQYGWPDAHIGSPTFKGNGGEYG